MTLKIRANEDHNKLEGREEESFRDHTFFIDILKNYPESQTITGH